ncbi:LiaF-related protein, partial [Streptomyces sp. ME02-6977A]|uniref:LiaF domain-containing protein n=1 Tax=Streptomyces sp. ME02-6977A TaxID=3028671 RepID=UPI0029BB821D
PLRTALLKTATTFSSGSAGAIPAEPDENVVAVFSSAVRKGRWRANRRIHAYAVFGSIEIDLSEAVFEYQQVVIKAFSVFGSVEVRVPENVSVRGAGGSVLGSFEVHTLDSSEAEAPVIYVDGWAVLGSVEARPKRGKVVADILDRVHRRVEKGLRKHV